MNTPRVALMAITLWSLGCTGSGSKPDLPPGWESAQSVKRFTQATCSGSPGMPGSPSEFIDATTSTGSVDVAYHAAHFRCDQSVEGFLRTSAGRADFLVQPTDMNPSSVAGCDCLYEITMAVSVMAGPVQVTVYRRWDHQNGNTDPVMIGTLSATVP